MQDIMLYAGQDDNYLSAQAHIQKYLQVKADDSQIKNLVSTYGDQLEAKVVELNADVQSKGADLASKVGEEEYVYGMIDGSMVYTREEGGGWKEMKLGRVFTDGVHHQINENRRWIRESLYAAHFGHCDQFLDKLEPILDHFEPLDERLVFINDGASWIWKRVEECYPKATQILDFFHACEYLTDFAKLFFKKEQERQIWIRTQKAALLADKVEQVIQIIRAFQTSGSGQEKEQEKILTYYENNKHRMSYKTFREKGMLIGSGPIESAHRVVIQKRMKQSGQRWTIKGGQQVANLRVVQINNQWNEVIELIKNPRKAA